MGLTESHKGTIKTNNLELLGPVWQYVSFYLDVEKQTLKKGQAQNASICLLKLKLSMRNLLGEQLYPNWGVEYCSEKDLKPEDLDSGQFCTWALKLAYYLTLSGSLSPNLLPIHFCCEDQMREYL